MARQPYTQTPPRPGILGGAPIAPRDRPTHFGGDTRGGQRRNANPVVRLRSEYAARLWVSTRSGWTSTRRRRPGRESWAASLNGRRFPLEHATSPHTQGCEGMRRAVDSCLTHGMRKLNATVPHTRGGSDQDQCDDDARSESDGAREEDVNSWRGCGLAGAHCLLDASPAGPGGEC